MENHINIEIIEFTDPACTWCWGSEPILRKLEYLYESNLEINYIMGGLVEDIRNFRDEFNNIGGNIEEINQQIAKHWLEASVKHGMPVEINGFKLFTEETPSTYPMNIAYKAAQFQSKTLAKKFLRRMREAVASEAKNANQIEVLIELVVETGLDLSRFMESFSDKTAEKAFHEDLKNTWTYQVHGFPSYLIKLSQGKEILLRGFQDFNTFQAVITQLSIGMLLPKQLGKTDQDILQFIQKYSRVAPIEITTTFDLSREETDQIIQCLEKDKQIRLLPAGNGYFITPASSSLSCNPKTGVCDRLF